MTPEEYLNQLREQLGSFSPEEQSCLLAEILSHIESGEEDPDLGRDPQSRRQRVMAELGTPEQMGSGFKQVHRPNRLLDFLIAFIPSLFIFPLISSFVFLFLTAFAGPEPATTPPALIIIGQASVLVSASLTLVSLWRRSVWLLLFWIPTTALYIISLLVYEQRWRFLGGGPASNMFESVIWYGLLLGLALAFIRLLWRNRANPLLVTFALLPILMTLTKSLLYLLSTAIGITYANPSITSSPEFTLINQLAGVAWIPLFFIPLNRRVRWLALALSTLVFLMKWGYLSGFHVLPVLFSTLPLLVVLLGWRLDKRDEPAVVFGW
ncbi:MAG: hypothetical protein P8Z00_11030 [Anaerolineales bacterium]